MISKINVFEKHCDRCDNAFVVISFKTMYNKRIIRLGFCDIRNNHGLGVSVISLSLRLQLITLTSTLIIPDITKTSFNNCLKFATFFLPSLLLFLKFCVIRAKLD